MEPTSPPAPLSPASYADWREARRFRVWTLYQQGWKQKAIADALGLTQGAVSQIVTRAKADGPDALRARKACGAAPRLSWQQTARLLRRLAGGAEACGFAGEVWTCGRVAALIAREFGGVYHPDHVGRLLHSWGWSCQKPVCRATQRNEEAIAEWTRERLPALKRGPREAGTNSCS